MRRIYYVFLLTATLGLLGTHEAEAQCITSTGVTCMTRTTFSANVAADDQVINVTSATGFTVGNGIWADFEQMEIISITGTAIRVNRGQNGTRAVAHDNGDNVFTGVDTGGPRGGGHFNTVDPNWAQDCTRGTGEASHMPWINVRTGDIWSCDLNAPAVDWVAFRKPVRTDNSDPASF